MHLNLGRNVISKCYRTGLKQVAIPSEEILCSHVVTSFSPSELQLIFRVVSKLPTELSKQTNYISLMSAINRLSSDRIAVSFFTRHEKLSGKLDPDKIIILIISSALHYFPCCFICYLVPVTATTHEMHLKWITGVACLSHAKCTRSNGIYCYDFNREFFT